MCFASMQTVGVTRGKKSLTAKIVSAHVQESDCLCATYQEKLMCPVCGNSLTLGTAQVRLISSVTLFSSSGALRGDSCTTGLPGASGTPAHQLIRSDKAASKEDIH
jgi:hypothetical protein